MTHNTPTIPPHALSTPPATRPHRPRFAVLSALTLLASAGSLTACEAPEEIDAAPEVDRKDDELTVLPVLKVQGNAVDEEHAEALADALKLPKNALGTGLLDENGALRFMDGERFLAIPTKTVQFKALPDEDKNEVASEAIAPDLSALEELKVMDKEEALSLTLELLASVDLKVPNATPGVTHSTFELRDTEDKPIIERPIDTTVHLTPQIAGVPLTGPGAKIKLAFDGQAELTQLVYARPLLEEVDSVVIIPPSSAADHCAESLKADAMPGKIGYTAELVYHVPADAAKGDLLLPQYACSGTQELGDEIIELRTTLVPAVLDQPKAAIVITPGPSSLIAEAEVEGGLAPYTYEWVREGGDRPLSAEEAGASLVEYTVTSRDPVDSVRESLRLIVTDARGISVNATAQAEIEAPVWTAPQTPRVGGVRDAGVEWIGSCGGLPGSKDNAGGFATRMSNDGVNVRFNYGNFNAWEEDFKDDSLGGNDDSYVDNTDIVFFTGHANGNGFAFCSENDDDFLRFDDAQWGNDHDLEWLVIAACGPLQAEADGRSWSDRWGPAFDRLHLLMAYASVSRDNTTEGKKLARYLTRDNPLDVRRAWIQTATDVQPGSVTWAVMGVAGTGYTIPNFSEHFWGHGSTGADVPADDIIGYWRISGAS